MIKERQKLDPLYEESYKKQSTLLWQYIGSPSGVLSMYPGMRDALHLKANQMCVLCSTKFIGHIIKLYLACSYTEVTKKAFNK